MHHISNAAPHDDSSLTHYLSLSLSPEAHFSSVHTTSPRRGKKWKRTTASNSAESSPSTYNRKNHTARISREDDIVYIQHAESLDAHSKEQSAWRSIRPTRTQNKKRTSRRIREREREREWSRILIAEENAHTGGAAARASRVGFFCGYKKSSVQLLSRSYVLSGIL